MSSHEPSVIVKNLSKSFKLPHEQHTGLKQAIINIFNTNRGYEKQEVLKDISFEIKKGEFYGIVGRNGSGKSTLLKLLAGIYVPDTGLVHINGTLTPFIELGVGFNPELTGRENVFLNGALLGFSRSEMDQMYDNIVQFAELDKFMDQKLKNYSSGMQVRLAFSIAIRAKSDVLLIDEVLAVGDAAFQQKCYKTFLDLKKEGRTIVFITHDMTAVQRFCDKVLILDKGNILTITDPRDASSIYETMNSEPAKPVSKAQQPARRGNGVAIIEDVYINGASKDNGIIIKQGENLSIDFKIHTTSSRPLIVGLAFHDAFGVELAGPNSRGVFMTTESFVSYSVANLPFNLGEYTITAALVDAETEEEMDHVQNITKFSVVSNPRRKQERGKILIPGNWKVK